MNVYGEIIGVLTSDGTISGEISAPQTITGEIAIPRSVLLPSYEGPYEVTPRIYEQTLETEGKQMDDDVTVYEIPITNTTNPYGGQTVVIG